MWRATERPVGRKGGGPASANRPRSRLPRAAVTVVPWSGAPAASSAGTTPRRSSSRTVSGLMYSEQALSRGKAARSSRTTRWPARASSAAAALPPGPAPTTTASTMDAASALTLVLEPIERQLVRREGVEGERHHQRAAAVGKGHRDHGVGAGPGAAQVGGARDPLGERLGHPGLPAGAVGGELPGGGHG